MIGRGSLFYKFYIVYFTGGSVAENSAIGTEVGTLSARDQDVGQILSFSLQSSKYLTVSGAKIRVGGAIDYEDTPTITFIANATDDGTPAKMVCILNSFLIYAPLGSLLVCQYHKAAHSVMPQGLH